MSKIKFALLAFAGMILVGCTVATVSGVDGNSSAQISSAGRVSSVVLLSSSSTVLASSSSVTHTSSSSVAIISSSSGACTNTYGTNSITDCRDSQLYKTVVIGSQTWMAQNLNFTPATGNSWCYNNAASNCTTYGRLYDYPTALMVCPTGWHLPDTSEWSTLETVVGPTNAGTLLKANSILWNSGSGTDSYGFAALPAGDLYVSFGNLGVYGNWWTTISGYYRYMSSGATIGYSSAPVTDGFSVRCIKNP